MIKVVNYNQVMQKEIKEFIVSNMKKELDVMDRKIFSKITEDLSNIEENYISKGGELLFAYDMQNKKIVGTIAVTTENGFSILKRFYVDKDYRNRKIGYLLYSKLEEIIIAKGVKRIYLTTGDELGSAHRFYERNGWKIEKDNPGIFLRDGAKLYKKNLAKTKSDENVDVCTKADILVEAIPHIRQFVGKIMVLKYGGNAMIDKVQRENVIKQIVLLKMLGIKVVVVHGGGVHIEEEIKKKEIEEEFDGKLKVVYEKTPEQEVLGETNAEIVKLLELQYCKAIGMSGNDNNAIKYKKSKKDSNGIQELKSIDKKSILNLIDNDYIPVISPIGVDCDGNLYNDVNADTIAAEIAIKLKAKKILLLTNIDGIIDKKGNVISLIKKEKIQELINDGTIVDGMIPKVEACIRCLENGVERTHILNGSKRNTIIYELLSDKGIGTMIV